MLYVKEKIFWLIPCLAFMTVVALTLATRHVPGGRWVLSPGQTSLVLWLAAKVVCKCVGGSSGTATSDNGGRTPTPGGLLPAMKHVIRVLAQSDREDATALLKIGNVCTNPNKLLEWHFGYFSCSGGTPPPPPPPGPC